MSITLGQVSNMVVTIDLVSHQGIQMTLFGGNSGDTFLGKCVGVGSGNFALWEFVYAK